jgi:hypothetical protein
MTIEAVQDRAEGSTSQPGYARFMPRLRALYIDAIIVMVVAFGVLFVAVTLRSDNIARVLGFTIVVKLAALRAVAGVICRRHDRTSPHEFAHRG